MRKLIKRPIKAKLGLGNIPMLNQFMSADGSTIDKTKLMSGLKSQGLGIVDNLSEVGREKAQNAIYADYDQNNPMASAIQTARRQGLKTAFGPLGGVAADALSIGETALAKDDCERDQITGEVLINPATGTCFKTKKNIADSLSPTGGIEDFVGAIRNIGQGHGFKDVASSFAAATPIGRILGVKDNIQARGANQQQLASVGRFDYQNQINEDKAAARQYMEQQNRFGLASQFGTYAKKGAMIPKLEDCGCTKDKDQLDTDIFYGMSRSLYNQVLERIGLPKNTPYSNKVKDVLKASVPHGKTLRQYVESISPEIKEYINR